MFKLLPLLLLPATIPSITASPTPRWSNSQQSLKALAKNSQKYFGTATMSNYIQQDQTYLSILQSEFDAYTPENEMKWEVIEPERGVFNWTGSDIIIAESKKTGSIVRGHNFCWSSQTPEYVTNITDPTQLKSVLKEHINAVLGRYKNDLAYFDVINEPLNSNGTFASSVWYDVLGEDYLEIALRYAHAAAPNLKLCINDYGIEDVNAKSESLASIASGLLKKGVPLHCIGFESHFIGGEFPGDIASSMKQFTDLGLEVPLTELDIRVPVNSNDVANSTELSIQATDYSHAIGACLGNCLCPGVTVWEFADQYSWIPSTFPGQGAADLYDANYNKKPAFYSVQTALADKSTAT